MVILVTGAKGQVGQAFGHIHKNYPQHTFYFADSAEADVTNLAALRQLFAAVKPDYVINAAAYTAVDKAESEPDRAALVNVKGVENVALACKEIKCTLVHISTDFVFDGTKKSPYSEDDQTNPQSVYGHTKREGEKALQAQMEQYFIIRTSWVYSQFGTNFFKTMLRLATERDALSVVNDQIGTPTNAVDLAEAILHIIQNDKQQYGIYNFSNEGECSWYDFAKKIFEINGVGIALRAISSAEYPTPAVRPKYSVLNKSKIINTFDIELKHWERSLNQML